MAKKERKGKVHSVKSSEGCVVIADTCLLTVARLLGNVMLWHQGAVHPGSLKLWGALWFLCKVCAGLSLAVPKDCPWSDGPGL